MVRNFGAAAAAVILASCSGGGAGTAPGPNPTPTPTPGPLVASPASVTFDIGQPLPQPQTVTIARGGAAIGPAVTVVVADPTVVGATETGTGTGAVTVTLYPVAHGSSTVTVGDANGSATITATTGTCGRPDNLRPSSQIVFPPPGASGVSTASGKVYFAVYSRVTPGTIALHLIAGSSAALEGGTLQIDTPPPGSATVGPPQANDQLTYMSATIPTLAPSVVYRSQLYDDACQPAILAGSFTT